MSFFEMESNFHMKGEFGSGQSSYAGAMTPAIGVDDAYVNGCYSGITFQAILQPFSSPMLNYCPCDGGVSFHSQPQMAVPLASAPATFGFFNHAFLATEAPQTSQFLGQDLKMPKQEALTNQDLAFELLKLHTTATTNDAASAGPLINFLASSSSANNEVNMYNADSNECFTHLPLLKSLEQQEAASEAQKGFKINDNPLNDSTSFSFPDNRVNSSSAVINRYMPYSSSGLARKRRQRISEKTRCLQKLLPWDKKMDMATMLEEAHKYIKFLQAQIRVLQSMPIHSSGNPNHGNEVKNEIITSTTRAKDVFGELEKLNRQQLLEVVVNSPVAQTVLYSRGCCVYSMEQLLLLKKMAEKKALMEQMLFSSIQYY